MPSLGLRVRGSGAARVLTLGLASGVASSCCAPVVVGVVAMSALAASPLGALGLAAAYVLGMVFPLFLAALFSDRLPQRWVGAATGSGGFVFRGRRIAWQDLMAAGVVTPIGWLRSPPALWLPDRRDGARLHSLASCSPLDRSRRKPMPFWRRVRRQPASASWPARRCFDSTSRSG